MMNVERCHLLSSVYFQNALSVEPFVNKDSEASIRITKASVVEGARRLERTLAKILAHEEGVSLYEFPICVKSARDALLKQNPFPTRTFYACISSASLVAGDVLERTCRAVVFGTRAILKIDAPLARGPFSDVINIPAHTTIQRRADEETGSARKSGLTPVTTEGVSLPAFTIPVLRTALAARKGTRVFTLYRPRRRSRIVPAGPEPVIVLQALQSPLDSDSVDKDLSIQIFDRPNPRVLAVPTIIATGCSGSLPVT
ncbi:hypothetical protein BT96DRAFT_970259 [Gymnopus androsaceus JB14]|uniref:Uncharacterized protein n=1 Tax=Gymnopus androsaceus JB14 TaxID=1447944 RepID=A0A6A4IFG6_9AGAR|nr:hypothetical protein BT96DRAFT_970259 [Gymnopus androsaceus JB14]